jgi:hypothetical protein
VRAGEIRYTISKWFYPPLRNGRRGRRRAIPVKDTDDKKMSERQNTLVCIFDMKSSRISAYNIHEWIFETVHLGEEDLAMIQIDGPKRNVYIKFKNTDKLQQVLLDSRGQRDYKHDTGEISKVQIAPAGKGMRTIRIANFPPEVTDRSILNTLVRYGEVKEII